MSATLQYEGIIKEITDERDANFGAIWAKYL